jgi:hypothetical protein
MLRPCIALLLAATGCGGASPSVDQGPDPDTGVYTSAHFSFHYTPIDSSSIAIIATRLEAQYGRITADLGAIGMRRVVVYLYTDHDALQEAVRPVVGTIPDWAIGLATAADRIHLMSPNGVGRDFDQMVTNLVHEFAHCASLHINSGIANNPRWLWESVAVYESGQLVPPASLAYLQSGTPPTLATMNSMANTQVYEVGYTIGEFIVSRWGQAGLADLVRSNGNLGLTLSITATAFEADWFTFVRARYNF